MVGRVIAFCPLHEINQGIGVSHIEFAQIPIIYAQSIGSKIDHIGIVFHFVSSGGGPVTVRAIIAWNAVELNDDIDICIIGSYFHEIEVVDVCAFQIIISI